MATLHHTFPQPQVTEIPKRNPTVPIKVGIFGGQGSGKTTSAALLAIAISKQFHGGAPVFVTDTEPGWQFLKPIFAQEGVELIQRTEPTFIGMCRDIREAQERGACVWVVDSLTVIWQELIQAARGNKSYIPIDQWGSIKATWSEYVTLFLNSKMHCFALARSKNDMEEILDEDAKKMKLVKVGTSFKAGGGESFGYEPHLLLEMSLERKAKRKNGQLLEGEGRMVHRVDVLKDRTWALNGAVIRWSDKSAYKPGGYTNVWESIRPHFVAVQKTLAPVQIQPGSSGELFDSSGDGEFYRLRQRKEVMCAEIKSCLDLFIGGRKQEDIETRIATTDLIFGVKSKEAADQLSLDKLERGLRILHNFEKNVAPPVGMPGTKEGILRMIAESVREYDEGKSEECNLPF